MSEHVRLFVSFPEELADRPMIYEVVKRFDVVPNIRRANVEQHSGWVILELTGVAGPARRLDRLPRRGRLHGQHDGRRRHRGMTSPPARRAARARTAAGSERRHPRGRRARAPRMGRAVGGAHPRRVGSHRRPTRASGPSATRSTPARPRPMRVVAELRVVVRARRRGATVDAARDRARARTASRPPCSRPPASRRSSATSSPSGPGPTTPTGSSSHGLGDLGDDDLAPLQMAWGMAKAKVLRARARQP